MRGRQHAKAQQGDAKGYGTCMRGWGSFSSSKPPALETWQPGFGCLFYACREKQEFLLQCMCIWLSCPAAAGEQQQQQAQDHARTPPSDLTARTRPLVLVPLLPCLSHGRGQQMSQEQKPAAGLEHGFKSISRYEGAANEAGGHVSESAHS